MIMTMTPKLSDALEELAATIAVSTSKSGSSGIEKDVGQTHQREIDPTAVVAGDRAEGRADEHLHDDGEEADGQRNARTEKETREQIPPNLVSAE